MRNCIIYYYSPTAITSAARLYPIIHTITYSDYSDNCLAECNSCYNNMVPVVEFPLNIDSTTVVRNLLLRERERERERERARQRGGEIHTIVRKRTKPQWQSWEMLKRQLQTGASDVWLGTFFSVVHVLSQVYDTQDYVVLATVHAQSKYLCVWFRVI